MIEIGVDIGGTFTDLAVYDPEADRMRFGKVLTTPGDPSLGVNDALETFGASPAEASAFVHGTTLAINTVIERTGARTALITTRGFRDSLELGRGNRPEAYNIYFKRLDPLVPRELRFELTERMNAQGEALTPPQLYELNGIVAQLRQQQVEAVAICFINSYRNPAHEIEVAKSLRERWPEGIISISSDLSREFREFERTSTTVVNAYVAPKLRRYLGGLEDVLARKDFRGPFYVVESNAGISTAATAKDRACFLMESGPVAGVIGSARVGELLGIRNVISFDMGGTTAKSCLVIDGIPPTTEDYWIGGYAQGYVLQVPVLDMVEVGAGGGSIAWVDEVGGIHVGPRSAGAAPGPACYDLGGEEPTVTDANLILGRLNEAYFADGRMRLDRLKAERAIHDKLASRFGMPLAETAAGMVDLANLAMAEAVRLVTIRRGLDPRDFVMVAYGGGGPLHASAIARDLAIPTVLIPPTPGNFSAIGMLLMDLRRDSSEMILRQLTPDTLIAMEEVFQRLQRSSEERIREEEGGRVERVVFQRFAEMRYRGQQTALKVMLGPALDLDDVRRRFEASYMQRYSHDPRNQPVEVVSIRLAAHGIRPRANLARFAIPNPADSSPSAQNDTVRDVYFKQSGGFVSTPVYRRESLQPGTRLQGPAVIEEPSSTTIVEPGDELEVNEYGHLLLHVARDG
ncbi:MAG TPA: hydantoinase/oxoprolinase family protein [Chloroflexota bacterium]|nr:hydantoinase/oxoprolinase family protein [Chloroflexota bacterium]